LAGRRSFRRDRSWWERPPGRDGTPDPFPVQDRVRRVAQALHADAQVVEILQIALDGQPDDLGAGAAKDAGGLVERG
jgi:hypothetical protein